MLDLYNNKTVSVIIPVYNTGKYVEKTLKSATNQTYQDLEIVVVDDCSEDNSREIIARYVKKHKNIIWHLQKKNVGVAVTRNKALALATGRYVAFLDSDDLWYPEKIAKQIAFMQEKQAAFCVTAFEMINEQDRLIKGKRAIKEKIMYQILLKNMLINTSSVVIDRNKTGNFQMPLFRTGEDYATWLQLLRKGFEAYGLNEVLVQYRKRPGSLSANKLESVPRFWKIQRESEGLPPLSVMVNSVCFAFNAFRKHYL